MPGSSAGAARDACARCCAGRGRRGARVPGIHCLLRHLPRPLQGSAPTEGSLRQAPEKEDWHGRWRPGRSSDGSRWRWLGWYRGRCPCVRGAGRARRHRWQRSRWWRGRRLGRSRLRTPRSCWRRRCQAARAQLLAAQPEVARVVVAYPAAVEWAVVEQVAEQALEPGAVERRCSQDSSR